MAKDDSIPMKDPCRNCGGKVIAKPRPAPTDALPYTAVCSGCGHWFDCRKPKD